MNTCETCKFWKMGFLEHNPDPKMARAGFRTCKCPMLDEVALSPLEMAYSKACFFSEVGPVYFLTGPGFGCVHHQVE